MTERRTELKVFRIDLYCDACGGEMIPTGLTIPSSPPRYPHKCEKCGIKINVPEHIFPLLEYEMLL